MSQRTADELLPLILPVARAYEQEIARLWRLYEVAPKLVDPWPDEPGKYAAWLLVQQAESLPSDRLGARRKGSQTSSKATYSDFDGGAS